MLEEGFGVLGAEFNPPVNERDYQRCVPVGILPILVMFRAGTPSFRQPRNP
jgi:hypothetical protein